MSDCEGCGAPMKPARHACEYCRRDYPRAAVPDIDWRAYQQQSMAANAYNSQCNSSLYQMLGAQNNCAGLGYGGAQQQNPWGWPS